MSKGQPFLVDLLSPDFPKTFIVRDETHRAHLAWALAASALLYTVIIVGITWSLTPRPVAQAEPSIFRSTEGAGAQAAEAPTTALYSSPTNVLVDSQSLTAIAQVLVYNTSTPMGATSTPLPTAEPTLTSTPLSTDTPVPTITPIPTATPIPSPTPIPDTTPGSILPLNETWRQGGLLATVNGFELLDKRCAYGQPQHIWGRWYVTIENTTDQQLAVDIRAEDFFFRDEFGTETVPYMVHGWGNCYFFENGGGFVDITSLNPGERVEIAVYGRGDRGAMSGFQFGIRNINDRIVNATWQVSIPR